MSVDATHGVGKKATVVTTKLLDYVISCARRRGKSANAKCV